MHNSHADAQAAIPLLLGSNTDLSVHKPYCTSCKPCTATINATRIKITVFVAKPDDDDDDDNQLKLPS